MNEWNDLELQRERLDQENEGVRSAGVKTEMVMSRSVGGEGYDNEWILDGGERLNESE